MSSAHRKDIRVRDIFANDEMKSEHIFS